MRKEIFYDKNAAKELSGFKEEVQEQFESYIEVLAKEGKLEFPEARKVSKNLFEIRVVRNNAYRGLYAYVKNDYIVLLHFFQKKTQKTPRQAIRVAEQRKRDYLRRKLDERSSKVH